MSEMPRSRIHYLIAVGLVVTVTLLLALAVQVGLTTAATGLSGASASGTTLQGKVRIEVKVNRRFTSSGAIRDRGRWVESSKAGVRDRWLIGAKGTIWIKIGFLGGRPRQCQCNWRIYGGTKAYAGLRGRGYEAGTLGGFSELGYLPPTHLMMYGTVSR